MKKYYKVVRNVRGRLYSCVVSSVTVNRREYSTKFWTEPASMAKKYNYGLLCFCDLRKAIDFFNALLAYNYKNETICHKLELWECEIEKEIDWKQTKSLRIRTTHVFFKVMKKKWMPWGNGHYRLSCWPAGTVMVEKIKLIKKKDGNDFLPINIFMGMC